jgi:hypothetical protein
MKKILKPIFFALVLVGLFATRVFAQDLSQLEINPQPNDGGSAYAALMTSLMNRIPVFLGGFAFLALLYSGGLYLFALGDANRMEMAKKNITWTIIGILAVALVFIVIKVVIQITTSTDFLGPGTVWGG